MKNLLPKDSDITIIGGGSAGLALAFHLAERDIGSMSVTIIESRHEYVNDRTWCFWDFGELHANLQSIIRMKWNKWSFSSGQNTIVHHSLSHPYCAVSSGDYYQYILKRIDGLNNFTLMKGCQADSVTAHKDGYLIHTSIGEIWSRFVIDTRPPIRDYHYIKKTPTEPAPSALFSGTPLYQIFFGVEVELESDFFDHSTVQLMSNLTEGHSGLAFNYILPYSTHRALVEYTTFTPHFFPAQQLKVQCKLALEELLGKGKFEVVYEEGAILPMGFSGVKSTKKNMLFAGIVGGSVRDSTGYSFIRTQRWADRCATMLMNGKIPKTMDCDKRIDEYLDLIFLRVLRRNPRLFPKLFMDLANCLSADAFARFMMEKSTLIDYLRVIFSMPKKPFINEILTTSR